MTRRWPSCRWRPCRICAACSTRAQRPLRHVDPDQAAAGADLNAARDRLQSHFPWQSFPYRIQTWRDMQGPLLAAVQLEDNDSQHPAVLIIAVGRLRDPATFYMIVRREDARRGDTPRPWARPDQGVMSIFGLNGFRWGWWARRRPPARLLFVRYINGNRDRAGARDGRPIFDPTVYYSEKFQRLSVLAHGGGRDGRRDRNCGALPASCRLAAPRRLHPVGLCAMSNPSAASTASVVVRPAGAPKSHLFPGLLPAASESRRSSCARAVCTRASQREDHDSVLRGWTWLWDAGR